jgi:hypothetical protein
MKYALSVFAGLFFLLKGSSGKGCVQLDSYSFDKVLNYPLSVLFRNIGILCLVEAIKFIIMVY